MAPESIGYRILDFGFKAGPDFEQFELLMIGGGAWHLTNLRAWRTREANRVRENQKEGV